MMTGLPPCSPVIFAKKNANGVWVVHQTNLPARRWFGYSDDERSMNHLIIDEIITWTGISTNVVIKCKSGENKHGLSCLSNVKIEDEDVLVIQFIIILSSQQFSATCTDYSPETFLLEHSRDALAYCGHDGIVQTTNTRLRELIGRDIIGENLFSLFETEDGHNTDVESMEKQLSAMTKPGYLHSIECHLKDPPLNTTTLMNAYNLWCRKTFTGICVRIAARKKWRQHHHAAAASMGGYSSASSKADSESEKGSVEDDKEDTREVRREEKAKHQQNELAFLSSHDAIMIHDIASGLRIRSNPSASSLFNYEEKDFQALHNYNLLEPDDPQLAEVNAALDGKGFYTGRLLLKRKIGGPLWVDACITTFTAQSRKYSMTVARDISDVVERESELEERYQKLQNSMSELARGDRMNLIGLLSAGVAHEINNPVTVLQGNLSCLQETIETSQRTLVRECMESTHRISAVVRVLASFSQTDQSLQLININDVIENVETLTRSEFRSITTLSLDLGKNLPNFYGDRGKLSQVLVNLLMNSMRAIQMTSRDTPHRVTIQTRELHFPKRVQILVSDTGCGIPDHVRSRLFRPFVTSRALGEGYGMGLTVCRGIIEQHKGNIQLMSSDPTGTTFSIILPVDNSLLPPQSPAVYQPAACKEETPRTNSPRDNKPQLLVVDDEALILRVYKRMLSSDFDVTTAGGGEEALDLLIDRSMKVDVVLCDLMMPAITGQAVYEKVKEKRPGLLPRFVFCSAGAVTPKMKEFSDYIQGLHPLIQKPASKEKLLSECKSIVRSASADDAPLLVSPAQ